MPLAKCYATSRAGVRREPATSVIFVSRSGRERACRERAVVASRLVRFTWRRRCTHASALSSGNVHLVTHSSTVLISYFDVDVTTYIYLPASTATRCILTGYALCVNLTHFFFCKMSRHVHKYWYRDEILYFWDFC